MRTVLAAILGIGLANNLFAAELGEKVRTAPLTDLYGDPLPDGAIVRMGTVRFRHGSSVTAVCYSPDGKTVSSASRDHTLRLWDPTTGKEVRAVAGHQSGVFSVAFSPDGARLVSASADNTLLVWRK